MTPGPPEPGTPKPEAPSDLSSPGLLDKVSEVWDPPPDAHIKVKRSPKAPEKDSSGTLGEWAILQATLTVLNSAPTEGEPETEEKNPFKVGEQGKVPWLITKSGKEIAKINPDYGTIALNFTPQGENKECFSPDQKEFLQEYLNQILKAAQKNDQSVEITIEGNSPASQELAQELRKHFRNSQAIKIRHATEPNFKDLYKDAPNTPETKRDPPPKEEKPSKEKGNPTPATTDDHSTTDPQEKTAESSKGAPPTTPTTSTTRSGGP